MKKRNKSQNPLVYWWNEFLFVRYFEYETDLSPQEIAEKLEAIAHKRQGWGWFWGLEKTSKSTIHSNEKGLDFDVQSRRRRLFYPISFTTAHILGTANVDSATGRTHVKGDVKLGRFIQVFFVLYLAIFLLIMSSLFFASSPFANDLGTILMKLFPMLIVGVVFSSFWLRIYTDRNNLAAVVEETIYTEKAKRATNRLSDNDTDVDNWYSEDADEHVNRQQNS